MRKRILFIAPNSLPINGPEAIVNAKLIKVLSNNYDIDVISKNTSNRYIAATLDEIFVQNVKNLKIITVDNSVTIRSIIDHFLSFLKTGYVYKGIHWSYYAIKHAEKLIKQNRYDYILSRNPPSEVVGLYLAKKYNIPWIANWNDPYPEIRMPEPYGGGSDAKISNNQRKLLDNICKYTAYQSFNSIRARDYMLQYMQYDLKKTIVIPHVCIEGLVELPNDKPSKKIKFVHSGNVAAPRNPYPFLYSVKTFLLYHPKAEIEFNFIGKQTTEFAKQVSKLDLSAHVKVHASLGYFENLQFISSQDIGVIIEAQSSNSVFLPTKVGDYMQCGKDILAISPQIGVLRDLYEKKAIRYFADCTNTQNIAEELEKIYKLYCSKNERYCSKTKIYHEFSEQHIRELYKKILK